MKKYFLHRFGKAAGILLLSMSLLFASCNDNSGNKDTGNKGKDTNSAVTRNDTASAKAAMPDESSLLTIASINEAADGRKVEIRFYEKAAPYSIDKTNKLYSANVDLLKQALSSNTPVKLVANPATRAISNFMKATDEEIRVYNAGEGPNSSKMKMRSAAPVLVDLNKIDTAKFNQVQYQLKFPIFKLCTNVVPDYATLVNIFNYCASQGCNNPPPYTITNCIPFQYVIDGCYARAHKMRQMIMAKYGYCVEKVFSYAQPYPNTLAVKADKWGGCCVFWWYHVAPLLRVNYKFGTTVVQVCYVIDPGMFNAPVTLSTWLAAQKNTSCSANANVTSYSIQPGSAYWPMGGGYGTDPNYTLTEQTLINYKNLHTCN